MTKLKIIRHRPYVLQQEYLDDCKDIQEILERQGYIASIKDIDKIWSDYSATRSAGWLGFVGTSDKQMLDNILEFGLADD